MADKVVLVEKDENKFLIKNLESNLELKFLARNPKDGGIFLLLGEFPDYVLFRGDERNGLKLCGRKFVQPFADCIAFMFTEDDKVIGEITDPDDLEEGGQPIFNEFAVEDNVRLEVLPCKVVR